MKKNKFIIFIILLVTATSLYARKPAVEDFVGVETQDYKETPQGTEVFFNFGNHLETENVSDTSSAWFGIVPLLVFVLLPFAMWFTITRSVSETSVNEEIPTTAQNVEVLDNYRNQDQTEDEKKKAS